MRVNGFSEQCRVARLWNYRLVVFIHSDDGIIKNHRLVFENFKGEFRFNVEEFTILADSKVCQTINSLVNLLLHDVILFGFERRVDFKGERYGSIVQFLGADIYGTSTFPDFDPVLAETGICQYVNIAGFFSHNRCGVYCYPAKLLIFPLSYVCKFCYFCKLARLMTGNEQLFGKHSRAGAGGIALMSSGVYISR